MKPRTHIRTGCLLPLLALALLVGCQGVTELCRHRVLSQHAAAVEQYGAANVEIWRLTNDNPVPYKYHAQVRVRPKGEGTAWLWLPNQHIETYLERAPQKGCTPLHKCDPKTLEQTN